MLDVREAYLTPGNLVRTLKVQGNDIAYEVTISEELRALLRARSTSEEPAPPVPDDEPGLPPSGASVDVFPNRRLRIDGSRPFAAPASEILTLRVGEAPAEVPGQAQGHQTLSLFLTKAGECVAHMVVEPPAGTPARPVYRLGHLHERGDVLSLVRRCQSDLEASIAIPPAPAGPEQPEPPCHQIRQTSERLAKALAPFVETS